MAHPGKAPTIALHLLTSNRWPIKPPACKPAEESDAGLSEARLSHPDTPRQLPQGPAWPRGNYLRDVGFFPLCRQGYLYYCRLRAGIPYIYTGGTASSHRTLLYILGGLSSQVTQSTFLPNYTLILPCILLIKYIVISIIHHI